MLFLSHHSTWYVTLIYSSSATQSISCVFNNTQVIPQQCHSNNFRNNLVAKQSKTNYTTAPAWTSGIFLFCNFWKLPFPIINHFVLCFLFYVFCKNFQIIHTSSHFNILIICCLFISLLAILVVLLLLLLWLKTNLL